MVLCNINLTNSLVQWEWRIPYMNDMLKEVIARPLQGKQVIFMLEDTLEEHLHGNTVLSTAVTPHVILTFPQHWEDAVTDLYHSIDFSKTWLPLCFCPVSVVYTCTSTHRHHTELHMLVPLRVFSVVEHVLDLKHFSCFLFLIMNSCLYKMF